MNSYQITAFHEPLELRSYEDPVPVGTEVLVRVDACGVCHSDLHIWSGYFDLGGGKRITLSERGVTPPHTMGHEIVGEVFALGPEASAIAVGTRGIVFPWIGCGTCRLCLAGRETACPNPRMLGTRRNGGYSDRVLVPHPRYIVPYGRLDPALAATCACSGLTAWSALRKLPPLEADDTVLIVGAGGVGLACVGLASALLPARIVVADISPQKREAALSAGAAGAVDGASATAIADILTISPRAPAAIIDFVGSPETMRLALGAIETGGTIVVVGLFGGEVALSIPPLPLRQLTIRGSYVGSLDELRELVGFMNGHEVATIPIRTRPMSEVNAILADLEAGGIVGRCVMTP